MGRKSRKKRERKEARRDDSFLTKLVPVDTRRTELDRVQLASALTHYARQQAERFDALQSEIQTTIRQREPLGLIATMAVYGLTCWLDEDGSVTASSNTQIKPDHIEIAQALCLRFTESEFSDGPSSPHHVQSIIDAVSELSDTFHAKRMGQLGENANQSQHAKLRAQEQMRVATQRVRNWGHYDQMKRIGRELVSEVDDEFRSVHGFRGTELVDVFDYMFKERERLNSEHYERLGPVVCATTKRSAFEAYKSAFPDVETSTDEFVTEMRNMKANLQSTIAMLMAHADLRLASTCCFDTGAVASEVGVSQQNVENLVERMSLSLGDLRAYEFEHLFLDNPVWTRPIIRLNRQEYFCAIPQVAFAFFFEIVERLIEYDGSLARNYRTRRGKYLENSAERVFSEAFPNGEVERSFKWYSDEEGKEFETDLLVKIDSALFVVEAKAGHVPATARRGAENSLRDAVEKLLVEPAQQGKRLEDKVRRAQSYPDDESVFRGKFPFEVDEITSVIRLSVSLEDLGSLQSTVRALKEADLAPPELSVNPSVTLADLECVFDMLDRAVEKVHYWVQRNRWEESVEYFGDEIDLLGVYLQTGLNADKYIKSATVLVLTGESAPVDDYYQAVRGGAAEGVKPSSKVTEWWSDMLAQLERNGGPRWVEAGHALLSADIETQAECEKRVKRLCESVRTDRELAVDRCALIVTPGQNRRELIAFMALTRKQMENRRDYMENVGVKAFEENDAADICVLVVLNVDSPRYPYSSLGCLVRGEVETA